MDNWKRYLLCLTACWLTGLSQAHAQARTREAVRLAPRYCPSDAAFVFKKMERVHESQDKVRGYLIGHRLFRYGRFTVLTEVSLDGERDDNKNPEFTVFASHKKITARYQNPDRFFDSGDLENIYIGFAKNSSTVYLIPQFYVENTFWYELLESRGNKARQVFWKDYALEYSDHQILEDGPPAPMTFSIGYKASRAYLMVRSPYRHDCILMRSR